MGTVSYNMMRQNENSCRYTINTGFGLQSCRSVTRDQHGGTAGISLNGAINTLMSNNVMTTQITSESKSKLSYRYYDYDNNTPELFFPIGCDRHHRPVHWHDICGPGHSLSISYNKQNAGAGLNWRPSK